jgi:hypothetical protein
VTDAAEIAVRRARLASVERELVRLRYRHDIAMSAFRFEEATGFGRALAALEQERHTLAASLPAPADEPPPTGIVPLLRQPRRRRRR